MAGKIFRIVIIGLIIWGAFWYGKNRSQEPQTNTDKQVEQTDQQESETDKDTSATKEEIVGFGQKNGGKLTEGMKNELMKDEKINGNGLIKDIVADVNAERKIAQYSNVVTDVTVYLYEWGIDVSDKTIEPGRVNFTVINNGQFSHNFALRGVKDFGKVLPGETKEFSAVYLRAGDFEIFSDKTVDIENGMTEVLEVE